MFSPTLHLSLIEVVAIGQTATGLSVTEEMEPRRTEAGCSRSHGAQAGGGHVAPSAGVPVHSSTSCLLEVGEETVRAQSGNPPTVPLGLGWDTGEAGPAWQEAERTRCPRQALRKEGQGLWPDT